MSNGASSTWRERVNSRLAVYYAGFAVLLIVVIVQSVRIALDWAAINRNAEQVVSSKQVQLTAQELQTAPLRGLDKKVDLGRGTLHTFYDKRIPPSYSSIASRFDELAVNPACGSRGCNTRRARSIRTSPKSRWTRASAAIIRRSCASSTASNVTKRFL